MGINHSVLGYFFNASPVVKLVMVVLLLASLLSWTIIFHRRSVLKQAKKQMVLFQKKFDGAADATQLWSMLNHRQARHPLSSMALIFQAGFKEYIRYKKLGATPDRMLQSIERALAIAEAKEMSSLDQYLPALATIGSTSPFIGLLGTVWGIMTSFQALGAVQQATMSMVAPGISEALIATAMGLFAAIPAVIAYNRFNSDINHMANQYTIFREECVALLARQIQAGEEYRPVVETKQPRMYLEDDPEYA